MKLFALLILLLVSPFAEEIILPTEKFQQAITQFEKDYNTRKPKGSHGEEHKAFVRISKSGYWRHGNHHLQAEVWQITLKGKKEIEANTYARVTITEFQFASAAKATEANTIIKEFSEEQWKMKTMNNYFIHGSCIYVIETDAVMFEEDYNSVTSRLKKYLEV